MHTRVSSGTYYSWAMLVPGRPDIPARGRPRMLLHLMCPVSPIASFFGNMRLLLLLLRPTPPPLAAPHTSSCLPSCMREREHSARTPMRERAQHACPNARETREGSQRTCTGPMREREGGSTAGMHMCWAGYMLHQGEPCLVVQGCLTQCMLAHKSEHVGEQLCRGAWRSACLPTSQSAWGEQHLLQHTEIRWNN
jgi:hypothetical protein